MVTEEVLLLRQEAKAQHLESALFTFYLPLSWLRCFSVPITRAGPRISVSSWLEQGPLLLPKGPGLDQDSFND